VRLGPLRACACCRTYKNQHEQTRRRAGTHWLERTPPKKHALGHAQWLASAQARKPLPSPPPLPPSSSLKPKARKGHLRSTSWISLTAGVPRSLCPVRTCMMAQQPLSAVRWPWIYRQPRRLKKGSLAVDVLSWAMSLHVGRAIYIFCVNH
jgi:hypothetical protein